MQLKRIAVNSLIVIISFLVVGTVVGGVGVPYVIAKDYDRRIKQVASSLKEEFSALENSTYLPLIDDPSALNDQKQTNAQTIKKRIESTLHKITMLELTANTLDTWSFPDLANFYRDAQIVRAKSLTIAAQTRTALKSYGDMVSFLESYTAIVDDARAEFNTFNTITNFNDFAGQGDNFRDKAAKLRRQAEALDHRAIPHELATSTAHLRELLNKMATGYEALGYGFDVAIDQNIYDAVAVIEDAGRELEVPKEQTSTTDLENSRVIKDVRQLDQKLDPLALAK